MPIIPLSKPDLDESDIQAAIRSLRGGRLSMGQATLAFEQLIARATQRPHAVAVSSGATALEIAMRALNVGPGHEVIIPSFSFAANVHSVLHVGATPVFADCDLRTLNASASSVESLITPRTRAILAVPVFGNPSGMAEVIAVADRHEILTIEHASEGLGSRLGADRVGRFGRLAAFGFSASRPICCGEGGALVTHDDHLAGICRALRNQGRTDRRSYPDQTADLGMLMSFSFTGYDARIPEVCAAIGASQLLRLEEIVEKRQALADLYMRRLAGCHDLTLPTMDPAARVSWSMFWVRLSDRFSEEDRDGVVDGLHRHDVGAANHYVPTHLLPEVRRKLNTLVGSCPVAESVSQRTITLPIYTSMTEVDIEHVCHSLEVVLSRTTATRV
ncbi:MAG: DegT/DnrJ/EryC1/StrS family aminotransferase [Phycisphaerales bacterium]|nr:DegT/DnrJ/EryC1/StrS family aminotransferase [Phycisphaerales bacterium]